MSNAKFVKKKYLCLIFMFLVFVLVGCSQHICNFGDWELITEPTYTTEGEERRFCDECEKYETRKIPKLVHSSCSYGAWVKTRQPTYILEGEEQRVCNVCGDIETREIPKLEYPYVITLNINDDCSKVYVEHSGVYNIESPVIEGYNFVEWIDDEGEIFASSGIITESKTIYAKFEVAETTTFEQLKSRVEAGVGEIYINADIEVTDSIYVYNDTVIYADKDCTILRACYFMGDIFVIGEDANGNNPLLENRRVTLTVKTNNDAKLIFDGNREKLSGKVAGTVFYITNSSIFEMYDNVVITNCLKLSNYRIIIEYGAHWENANLAGGSAVMNAYGTFNMYGGKITNNEINLLDSTPNPDLENSSYNSSYGGAVLNRSAFNMYGGIIENNKAGRGGAVYNYQSFVMYGGEILNNYSASYGGAIYLPNSQNTTLKIGQVVNENVVNISGNSSDYSGGAIFGQTLTNFMIIGATTFDGNKANSGNGGAICTSGSLLANDVTFKNNATESRGGAVYLYYRDNDNDVRYSDIKNSTFSYNTAEYGAGISLYSSDANFNQGAIATISNCYFYSNKVTNNGGAVYAGRSSEVTITDTIFEENISNSTEYGGGAVYFTASKGIFKNIEFKGNSSTFNGGALALYSESEVLATSLQFNNNVSTKSGGAIYLSKSTLTVDKDVTLWKNAAGTTGGAITAYSSSTITITGITAKENSSEENGGAIYISSSVVTIDKETSSDSVISLNASGENGGAVAVHSAGTINIYGIIFSENEATENGGAVYVKGAKANVGSAEKVINNTFEKNKAKNGGAIYLETSSTNNVELNAYNLTATGNKATNNGGALYAYTSSKVLIENLDAQGNTSDNYGGFAYISGKAYVEIQNVEATKNKSTKGGFVYITTTSTELRILKGKLTENIASEGTDIYSNSSGAIIRIKGGEESTEVVYDDGGIAGKSTIQDIETTDEEV